MSQIRTNSIVPAGGLVGDGGGIIQTVQGTSTTEFLTTSSSYSDTNLSASITPQSTSSKILIIVSQPIYITRNSTNSWGGVRLLRGGTQLAVCNVGTATAKNVSRDGNSVAFCYLDSPATTSSTTYKTQGRTTNGTSMYADHNENLSEQTTGLITLLEISG